MANEPTREEQAAQDLREATRAAHEAIQDLRAATKDARQALGAIDQAIDQATARVDETVERRIVAQLDDLAKATKQAMDRSVAKVGREFDRLEAIFTGRDPESVREGKPPLEELLRKARDAKDPGRAASFALTHFRPDALTDGDESDRG